MRTSFLLVFLLGSTAASWAAPSPEAILKKSYRALQSIHQVYFEVSGKSKTTEDKAYDAQLWAYRTPADTATPWENILIVSEWADWRFDGVTYSSALHADREVRTSANDPRLEGFRATRGGPAKIFYLREFFEPELLLKRWGTAEELQVFNEGDSWVIGMAISTVGYQKLYFRKSDFLPWKKQEGFLKGIVQKEVTITYLNLEASNASQAIADFPGWPNYTVTNANERPRPSSTLQEGDQAPAWSLTSFQERDWTSEETRGQNLLLVIWQEECNNCQRALDEVNNWQVDFEGKDLIIFSMVNNPSQELQDRLLNQPDRIYTHLHLTAETLEAFGPNDYPFFSIIDKEGIVRHLEMGYNQAYVRQWLLDNLE